ncbi:WD repeat-containing protein 6 [Sorex araneus]|uniref:WD repeat-containing protein 6 n=1 Tax=Sorex araneus TaxID=42254 RepID=UPI00015823E5|nr:WD repeat-containing protein 6 [Sorex araneus]
MDAHEDSTWPRASSELILLPVTGLECVGDRLLAGEGPDVLVYSLDLGGHLRMMKRVQNLLGHYLIHGFRVRPDPKGNLDTEAMVAVFGSKGLRIVKVSWGQGRFRELWRSGLWNMSDWIWDAHWLEGNIALALGHNSVVLYDPVVGCVQQEVHCTDRCTLSSACLIGDSWKELTIVAGAVSNQLLVWYPATGSTDEPVAPDRRVSGHVGVIFSMSYLESKGLLATASEDRSVRIWKVGDLRVPGGRVQNIGHCFGHSARVWQVKLLENYLISAGEDCVCLVWSHEGEILQAFRGHQGRGIRALATHEGQAWVVTGGDDSGIRLWHLVGRGCPGSGVSSLEFKSQNRPGALKAVTLAGSWRLLAVTDVGTLYLYDLEVKSWEQLLEDKHFQSYCLLEAAPGPEGFGLCAMANGEGRVKVVPINTPTAAVDLTPFNGKVHSLSWALRGYEELLLLASGPGGVITCLEITAAPSGKAIFVKERCRYLLPPSKQRWHTCSAFLPPGDFLVCGDRRGSVMLFPSRPNLLKDLDIGGKLGIAALALGVTSNSSGVDDDSMEEWGPVSTLPSLHGKQGVTSVTCHGGYVYTTGRDGAYYQLFVRNGQLHPVLRQKSCRGMNWVAGLRMMADGSTVILGFHANEFVVWSPRSHEKLHIINCGGGHRSWAFSDTEAAMAFTYLKDGEVMLYRALGGCTRPHVILRESLHGREITCVKRVGTITLGPEYGVPNLMDPDQVEPANEGPGLTDIVITCSEDTTVCVLALPTATGAAHALTAVCNHISSVRALAVWGVSTPGGTKDPRPGLTAHVVSAGGRAEMHCFSLMITPDTCTPSRLACHVMHLSSHRLDEYWDRQRNRHQMVKVDPETRYMCLAVCESDKPGLGPILAAACSDGAVRLFLLQDSGRRLQLLAETFHHKRCVLKVHSFTHEVPNQRRRLFLCSAATDGSLAFWDLTTVLDHGSKALEPPAEPGLPYRLGTPCLTVQAHSSGVNSLHTLPTSDGHLVASGSEDGSLHVFVLAVEMPEQEEAVGGVEVIPQLKVLEEYSVPSAHAAHVTGLKILSPSLMVTASIDQRLTFWRLGHGEPSFMNSAVYHVPDVADMDCWPVSPEFGHRCALGGQGLEIYNWYD